MSRLVRPVIRQALPSDGPRLQMVERLAGERFRSVGMDAVADDEPPTLQDLADAAGAGRSWVAVDGDDVPMGYVLLALVDGTAHVEQVSVDPVHQGRGIGRALLDHAAAWGIARGVHATTLTTFADVPWNGPLYEHLGFTRLDDADLGPGLAEVRRREVERGLDAHGRRIAMRRPTAPDMPDRGPTGDQGT